MIPWKPTFRNGPHVKSAFPAVQLKFVFSKKATKIDKIFSVDLTLTT